MVRHSKKNRRGGDKIEDIQSQVDSLQQQLNELKTEMLLLQNKQNTSEPELTDQELEAMFEMCL